MTPSSQTGAQGSRVPVQVALDWTAYASGELPRTGMTSTATLERVWSVPAGVGPARAGNDEVRVPKTLTSYRIINLAQMIIGKSLFLDGFLLRLSAASAMSLDDVLSGRDLWIEHALGVTCRQSLQA